MSGLGQNTGGAIYLNGKAGKFYLSTDKEKTTPYSDLTGLLLGIEYKEETYNNAPIQKAYFNVSTAEGLYKFNLNTSNGSYGNLISFLKNADISKDITFVPIGEQAEGDKINTSYLVKQGGNALRGFFVKDVNPLPRWEAVQVNGVDFIQNGRKVWDRTKYMAALATAVDEINAAAKANSPVEVTATAPTATQTATGTVTQTQAAPGTQPTTSTTAAGTVTKVQVAPPVDNEPDDLPF